MPKKLIEFFPGIFLAFAIELGIQSFHPHLTIPRVQMKRVLSMIDVEEAQHLQGALEGCRRLVNQ